MDFGIVLGFTGPQQNSYRFEDRVEASAQMFPHVLELATTADAQGVSYMWTQEHHLIEVIQSPSALLTAVWVSQHVRAKVGTAVIVVPYHEPIQLAGEIAQADQLTGGRLQLGVARGAYKYEFEKFGIDFATSRDNFIEKLEAVRALLNNETTETSFHGQFVNFDDAYIWPRPLQRPMPPLWMGAQAPGAIEDGARRGYNVFTSLFLWDDDHLATLAESFHKGKAESGRDDLLFGATRYAYVAEDEADAEKAVDAIIAKWRVMQQLHDFTHSENPLGIIPEREIPNEPTRESVRANLLIGTMPQLRAKLDRYQELGVDLVNLAVNFGMPHEAVIRSTNRLGELVEAYRTPR